jgi:hypothetical protein
MWVFDQSTQSSPLSLSFFSLPRTEALLALVPFHLLPNPPDLIQIYQNDNMTCLKNLMWYTVFGNHDIVATGSIDAQIAYGFRNPT